MKTLKFKSLEELSESPILEAISKDSLLLSDIDGVYFKGLWDPREWVGIIHNRKLNALKKILKCGPACWIFTNRKYFFRKFPFIIQLKSIMSEFTNEKIPILPNVKKVLRTENLRFQIIMNARKPNPSSQRVLKEALRNYETVFYVASREIPFYFTDLELVNSSNLSSKYSKKLFFIEISYF